MITASDMVRSKTTVRIGTPEAWRIAPDSNTCLISFAVKSSGLIGLASPIGSPLEFLLEYRNSLKQSRIRFRSDGSRTRPDFSGGGSTSLGENPGLATIALAR